MLLAGFQRSHSVATCGDTCTGDQGLSEGVTGPRICGAGLEETDALRLRGQGHSGRYGGPPGDVYLSFMVRLNHWSQLLEQLSLFAPNHS